MRRLQILQQNLFISASSFVQHAGIAALAEGAEMSAALLDACGDRRRLLVDGLRGLGFGIEHEPEGAFYVLADCRAFGSDPGPRLRHSRAGPRGCTPGIDFGEAAEGRLRFCYAVARETIETALDRMAPALAARRENGEGA